MLWGGDNQFTVDGEVDDDWVEMGRRRCDWIPTHFPSFFVVGVDDVIDKKFDDGTQSGLG